MTNISKQLINWTTEHHTHPVFFGQPFHFLVKEEVDSKGMTGSVGEHSTEDFAVLVTHSFSHMQKNRVVDFLNMDPVQGNIR